MRMSAGCELQLGYGGGEAGCWELLRWREAFAAGGVHNSPPWNEYLWFRHMFSNLSFWGHCDHAREAVPTHLRSLAADENSMVQ